MRDMIHVGLNAGQLRGAAFTVISRGQDHPATQVLGTAVALVAMSEAAGVPMRRLIEIAEQVMADIDGPYGPEIRAIKEYTRNEIGRVRL